MPFKAISFFVFWNSILMSMMIFAIVLLLLCLNCHSVPTEHSIEVDNEISDAIAICDIYCEIKITELRALTFQLWIEGDTEVLSSVSTSELNNLRIHITDFARSEGFGFYVYAEDKEYLSEIASLVNRLLGRQVARDVRLTEVSLSEWMPT